jgi:hypothetical protein
VFKIPRMAEESLKDELRAALPHVPCVSAATCSLGHPWKRMTRRSRLARRPGLLPESSDDADSEKPYRPARHVRCARERMPTISAVTERVSSP